MVLASKKDPMHFSAQDLFPSVSFCFHPDQLQVPFDLIQSFLLLFDECSSLFRIPDPDPCLLSDILQPIANFR